MGIEWEFSITPIDPDAYTASITAVRIEDDSTETHRIDTAILQTSAQKTAVLNQIWQMHLDYQSRQTAIDNYLGGLEAAAKSNLEARE